MTSRHHGIPVLLFAILVASFTGCGSPEDRAFRKNIDLLNQMAAAIENNAPEKTLESLSEKMQKNAKRLQELNLTPQQMAELMQKYEKQLADVRQRMVSALMKRTMSDFNAPNFDMFPGFPSSR